MPIHPSLPQQMMGAFSFNGKSSKDYGLVCLSVKRPILPAPKLRMVEIGGQSGAYALPTKHYELLHLTVKVQYIGDAGMSAYPFTVRPVADPSFFEVRTRARAIGLWLAGTGSWCPLIFDDEPSVTYQAMVESEVEIELEGEQYPFATAEINFVAQPIIPGKTLDLFDSVVIT